MNILLFSKYPPLQGGVSAAALFASVEAAKNGHTIFVVTNSNHATTTNRIAISCLDTEDMTGLNKNRELQGQLEVIQTSNLNNQRHLISGQNCEIIEDPNDTDHLSLTIRNLLTNRNHRRRLQINGYNLSSILEKSISYENPLEQLVEAHQSLVSKAHQGY